MTNNLSVKGVTRRHAGFFTRLEIFLDGGTISVRDHLLNGNGSLRDRLEDMARREISFSVSECIYGWTASYRQVWTHITVRINLNPDAGISNATMANLRNTWENTIEARWSDTWSAVRSGELACPFTFDVQWVNSNAHHNVQVSVGGGTVMTLWHTTDPGSTASHEFGHMLGNPDEYSSAACPDRSPVNTGTIMDNNTNNIPSRLLSTLVNELGSGFVPA